MESVKKNIKSSFRLSGFNIETNAIDYFTEILQNNLGNDETQIELHDTWITKAIDSVLNLKLNSNLIDKKVIESALNKLNINVSDEFNLINAYEIPRFLYNLEQKKFYLDKNEDEKNHRSFLPEADMKSKYILDRYTLLHQKTIRHELFSKPIEGITNEMKKFTLSYVEFLLSQSKLNEVVVLGLLTQLTEGKFYLEDPTGYVQIDLSKASFHSGFFCEGSFVLVEGKYQDNILTVSSIGFPPPEPAASSRSYYGVQNSWGGKSEKLDKYSEQLAEIERRNKEATLVFLSDVRLDQPIVMEKLKLLFLGYDDCPPVCIVLMGPFFDKKKTNNQRKQLFNALGDLVSTCDHLKKSTDLVLVPSQDDSAAANILPRPQIPECLVKGLRKKWSRLKLATNPCRISYCTQQIVICRLDLVTKLCRNTIHFPDSGELENHFARTLICQGTLAPVTQNVLPIYWDYDAALQLYPLPDLIVIGDPSDSFTTTHLDCTVINTGSFIKSKYSFKVYVPATKTIEDSEIGDNEND